MKFNRERINKSYTEHNTSYWCWRDELFVRSKFVHHTREYTYWQQLRTTTRANNITNGVINMPPLRGMISFTVIFRSNVLITRWRFEFYPCEFRYAYEKQYTFRNV